MSDKLLFYYLGDDEAYYRALLGEFRKHAKIAIDFQRLSGANESSIQSLFLKVFTDKPACVFIDFSKNTPDYLHLARLLSRTPLEQNCLLVGLVDYLSPPEVLKESVVTGVALNYIKSAETFDTVFDVCKLIAPQAIGEHGFATATLSEEWQSGMLCKIGFIHAEGLHLETDFPLSKGDRLKLEHAWLEKKIVPSKQMFVSNVSSSNMFYQFKGNADLDFLFVDEFIPPEGYTEDDIKQKAAEREDAIKYHKKQLKRWIEDNISRSQEKKARLLVVDYKFHLYQDQARTDKHPYTIRCIPFFKEIEQEIDRLRPQIVAFQFEPEKNTIEGLKKLVSCIFTKFPELKPFIIAFSTDMSSAELQATLSYPQALAHKDEISSDLLIRLADMLQKKMSKGQEADALEASVFLKKTNPASIGEIQHTVSIVKLSETDLIVQTDVPFPPGTNLHFSSPVEMFVNIQPMPKGNSKLPEYYGMIHSLGETEKKELRRFVNSVFFRDHDAQLVAEGEEFKKLNEAKLAEKVLAIQKAQEAAAAKAAADAAKKAADEAAKTAPEAPADEAKEPEAG